MSTVTSVWSAANGGSLAYPAHDGLPALTLTHAQAYYAHDTRAGQYPVRVGYLTKTGGASRSYVLWSDGLATSADSDEGWTVRADRTGEVLTVVLGQLDAVAAADASRIAQLSQQVQTLQQQVQTLQSQQGNGNGKLPLATLRPVLANLIVAQQALARGTAAVNDARALAGKLVG